MTSADAFAALRIAAAAGPYFAVELDEVSADDPAWLPFTELIGNPDVLAGRVAVVVDALAVRCGLPAAEVDARAAASIHFLALASRLVAPPLAAAALTGIVAAGGVGELFWQPVEGGPVPFAWEGAHTRIADDVRHAAVLLHERVIEPLVRPLVEAFANVSDQVLWGNVASAVAGAASILERSDRAFALHPPAVARAVLDLGPLAGTGSFERPERFFVRASCCLFYRIPNAGKCGDCVLL